MNNRLHKLCLIGGASGTGKSTLLDKLIKSIFIKTFFKKSPRLEFVDTDITRESVKSRYHDEFDSWILCQPATLLNNEDFVKQSELVFTRVYEKMPRRICKNDGTIVAGVNVIPGIFEEQRFEGLLDVKQALLVISDFDEHFTRYYRRNVKVHGSTDYDETERVTYKIRKQQDFLITRALRHNVPIIESDRKAPRKILDFINL